MVRRLKIVADENMPGLKTLFSDLADITLINGRGISQKQLLEADALLCRSITPVNANLLTNTQVKFVGTATIGVDHLDTNWLNQKQVAWSNAAGCNAPAVGQYVLSAIAYWCIKNKRSIKKLSVGIVGAGNVGTVLAKYLDFYGIDYKLYDPPLLEKGDSRSFSDFQSILKCDVITLHVPITTKGSHATQHLFSTNVLTQLNNRQLLINASRGAVINNHDLEDYLSAPKGKNNIAQCVLDVFENEPNINLSLVKNCLLATPHIAGHTLEGKLRGTWMIYQAFCQHFGITNSKKEIELYPPNNEINLVDLPLEKQLLLVYDILLDSNSLKHLTKTQVKFQFDQLRKNATLLSNNQIRRDYAGWSTTNPSSKSLLPS